MSFGTPAYDISHLLGGGVLLLSFVMLYQRRIGAVINAFAVQGAVLAAAAAWQGWVQDAPGLYITAAIAFGAKAVAIPLAFRLLLGRLGQHKAVETSPGLGVTLTAAIGLVGLAAVSYTHLTLPTIYSV